MVDFTWIIRLRYASVGLINQLVYQFIGQIITYCYSFTTQMITLFKSSAYFMIPTRLINQNDCDSSV